MPQKIMTAVNRMPDAINHALRLAWPRLAEKSPELFGLLVVFSRLAVAAGNASGIPQAPITVRLAA